MKRKKSEETVIEAPKNEIPEMGNKRIPPALYWEYRTTLEEYLHAKTQTLLMSEKFQNQSALIEISRLKLMLFKLQVDAVKAKEDKSDKDYKEFISRIETELNVSLKSAAIHPVTFEITTFEEPEKK